MRKRLLKGTTPAENHRLKTGEVQLNVDIPRGMSVALKKLAKAEGTKVKSIVSRALLRYLVKEGAMRP